MSYLRFSWLVIVLMFTNTLTACNESGGNTDNSDTANNPTGQYDLVDYFFNETLSVPSNSISYMVTFYNTSDGSMVAQYTDKYEALSNANIYWTSDGIPAGTFVITTSTIEETVHSADDDLRPSQRYVDVGTEYMNHDTDTILGDQNAACKVIAHHPTVDLSEKTGSFALATGIYNDVLEINCVTSIVVQGSNSPHTNLTHFFARDIGIIFSAGNLLFLGNVYIVPAL